MVDQGGTYLAFIEGELKAERDRRSTYDARGQALVTTSGALVTLLAGLAALVKTAATPQFPPVVLISVAAALVLIVAAAACGIVASWNKQYVVARATTLSIMLGEHWTDDEVDARNNVATLQLRTLDSLRKANQFKVAWVATGLITQVIALMVLGGATVMLIASL